MLFLVVLLVRYQEVKYQEDKYAARMRMSKGKARERQEDWS